eukprot:289928_1
MKLKTSSKGVIHSFQISQNSALSSPLLTNEMNETEWIKSISSLQYILIPIGIVNLFPNQTPNKLQIAISYIFPVALLIMPLYLINPNSNTYLTQTNSSSFGIYLLYTIYALIFFNTMFVYWYIRWYFLGKQHHIFLMIHLYEYIKDSLNNNTLLMNNILTQYQKSIAKTCKYCTIFFYCFIVMVTIVWLWLGAFEYQIFYGHKTNTLLYNIVTVFAYNYQIWWTHAMGLAIFIVNLKLLQLRYYAFSAKICISSKYNKLLNLNRLQTVYQSNENINEIALQNVDDINKEYLDIILMFQNKIIKKIIK